MLSWQSSDGPIGASRRGVGRGNGVSSEDGERTSARDLSAKSASGRDAQFVDQGEVWTAPVQCARIKQGGDGSVVGVSDLQHPCVDSSTLAATRKGGGKGGVVKGRKKVLKTEKSRVWAADAHNRMSESLKPLSTGGFLQLRDR